MEKLERKHLLYKGEYLGGGDSCVDKSDCSQNKEGSRNSFTTFIVSV